MPFRHKILRIWINYALLMRKFDALFPHFLAQSVDLFAFRMYGLGFCKLPLKHKGSEHFVYSKVFAAFGPWTSWTSRYCMILTPAVMEKYFLTGRM